MDRLSSLLTRFAVHAGVFHSGAFCGISAFDGNGATGTVHLLRAGRVSVTLADGQELTITEPALLFIARPYRHRLHSVEADQTELVCAALGFDGGSGNPLASAFPDYLLLPLADLPQLRQTLEWLFAEAFGEGCGRMAMVDRLFELLVIQLMRHVLDTGGVRGGMLAGLADPRLARALNLIHAAPGDALSLDTLAAAALMSRARFAAHFHAVIGQSPGDYLLEWRLGLARQRLREGVSIQIVAGEVGYESPSALARAFRRKTGQSPREWLRDQAIKP
ncbi:AraC family transcriptional regulator [Silvimonas iriomotensis]|uniref:AraC family transcriptional regulator n=1 Tax=Silvimonas iriomotensis TaxID=449662 RepID=A0ABQ2PBC1_9NEIS|nr:AraC family transcriptional regulator [Silvimonas iriomotensis]GGP22419.1 AraC family transcriptional regulator [Silvimonas iriomotensis]